MILASHYTSRRSKHLISNMFPLFFSSLLGLVRDSESRYRRIFENVQDVYYEMRTDGILLELSPASGRNPGS